MPPPSAETRASTRSYATTGFPIAMYSTTLFMVDRSLKAFFGSGAMQTSAVDRTRTISASPTIPVNSTWPAIPSWPARRTIDARTSPSPMKTACQSAARCAGRQRAQRMVDAVLRAHHAEVRDQVLPAAAECRVRLDRANVSRSGALRTTKTSLGRLRPRPSATDRYESFGTITTFARRYEIRSSEARR